MKKEWEKLQQRTREGFGGEKTEIPPELVEKKHKAEKLKKGLEGLISKTEVLVQPDPTKRVTSAFGVKDSATKLPLYVFGQALAGTANDYDTGLSNLLKTCGETLVQLAEFNNDFNNELKDTFVHPKQAFIKEDIKGAFDEFDKLNSKRLEFDAAKHKLKSAKEEKRFHVEQEVSKAQQKFDESLAVTRARLDYVTDDQEFVRAQKAQLMNMMQILLEYHRKSFTLINNLNDLYHFADNTSYTQREKPDFSAAYVPSSSTSTATSFPSMSTAPQSSLGTSSVSSVSSISSPPPPLSAPGKKKARALYDFPATQEGDLGLKAGDLVEVTDTSHPDWWTGTVNGTTGIFPKNYVEMI
eukprot:TRINITY_DN3996_c0_g1_i1.p1 TRINITY_DN3996_c0_g1~~TRINITY_DN3996_c0_g1_i1.p1  ORF type:complete len:364 (-),score=73.89 TRINITY_DN3996_c0_g1_i1:109-1173(-)